MTPVISIIIPCYNLGHYLDACLKSISSQAVGEVEYIFVNDGSTDNTLKKLKDFTYNKPYCKLISQKNSGVSSARNAAIDISEGKYIYLLDGDDILTENAIRHMISDTADNPDVVISMAERLKGDDIKKIPFPFKVGLYSPEELYKSSSFFHPATQLLFRREIIEKYNIRFDKSLSLGEVYDFTLRYLRYAERIKVVPHCYFRYVYRPESATRNPVYTRDLTIIESITK